MSSAEELETLQRYIARLRVRVEQQAKHVDGLVDYPELAKRGSEILALDSENLRLALIQVEELKAQVAKEADAKETSVADKSNVA